MINRDNLTPVLNTFGMIEFLSNDDPCLNNPKTIKLKWSDIVVARTSK